jgi:Glyoxalase-like domain
MTIQLRQICLVAAELAPVIDDLEAVLGIRRCYVDPGVGVFGLENTLLPVGRNFLEVVAPTQPDTAGGRYLERRKGDGGYMVITQADTKANQQAVRQRALDNGVRVAWERDRDDWALCQLHPGDMRAAFLEIEWDREENLSGRWMPAGGTGWEDKVCQDLTVDFLGAELQGPDPEALADLWSRVIGAPVERVDGTPAVRLNNATLRFARARDGRGPGLSGLDIAVRDPDEVRARAAARGRPIRDGAVDLCGVWFTLVKV